MKTLLFSKLTKVIFFNQHPLPIQKMLDYDWVCKKDEPSIVAIVNPGNPGLHKCFFGTQEITIPVFGSVEAAAVAYPKADVFMNFASQRSAYAASLEAFEKTELLFKHIIVAEGMPENESRHLSQLAKDKDGWIIGPATVGTVKAGAFVSGYAGGTIDNIIQSRMYRPGSVGVVTVSGGMFNELNNIANKFADGLNEGVQIGGDTYPASSLVDNLVRLNMQPEIKMLAMLGEIGGEAEYEVVEALKQKRITKPLIAWVAGTVATQFKTEVQFGHAGARSGGKGESAQEKNAALKEAGAFVPASFNDFGNLVKEVFEKYVASDANYKAPVDDDFRQPAVDLKEAVRKGIARRTTSITSTISDDRAEEATYNKVPIADYATKPLGSVINALWFQGQLNDTAEEFIELCLKLTADHGPAVATAHNAIVAARAGKDLVASVAAGMLTIGPRHGGAIDGAAEWLFDGVSRGINGRQVLDEKKKAGELIMGIGHKVKTAQNPDHRVNVLKDFAAKKLSSNKYLDFALEVERETLKKKNNLILNVDGAIAAVFLDVLDSAGLKANEIKTIIDIGSLNGIFVLGRTIGMIGHVLDQKRLGEGIYRHPTDDILYL